MKLKRILATVLALVMVLSVMSFSVFATASTITVSNSEELIAALAGEDANVTITMLNDITVEAGLSNAYGKTGINILYGQTLDGNGYTLKVEGADGTWDSAINTTGGIIKNLKIDSGFRGIFVNHNSTYSNLVVLENVTIEGPVYTISCDQGTNKGLRAINCTFNGWTSYAATIGNVEFINCNFGEGAGYEFCRPYAPTNFVECDFGGGYEMDPRAESSLVSCKKDGEDITQENLGDLVTSNPINAKTDNEKIAYILGKGGYVTLQDAIDAVVAGDNTITVLADISDDIIVPQTEGVNITIDGNGNEFSGSIEIDGNARHAGAETLTIQNVNFVASSKKDFIHQNSTASDIRYPHNVTVKDCTFTANTDEDVVGLRIRQGNDINVINCVFSNMHSVMWAQGTPNIVVDKITATDMKNGISAGGDSSGLVVKNSAISALSDTGYGVRVEGTGAYDATVENCTIDAAIPVLVRKATSSDYTITVNNSTLNTTSDYAFAIGVTASDFETPGQILDAPTGNININFDKDYAISSYVAITSGKGYTTLDDAVAAAAAGAEITLLNDAELNTKLNNATINIDLNGYKMDVNVGSNYIIGENSISNGTVDISNASSSQNIFGLAQYKTPATTLTMDNVNFIGDGFNSGYAVFEIGNSGADVALTITDSTIDLKNDNATQGGFVKGSGPNCVLTITNTEVTLDNTDMFNVNVAANITDSEFTISNLSDTAFRNLGGTIDNSVISVTNSSNGIRNSTAGYNLAVKNNSSIKISGSTNTEEGKVGDLVLAAGNKVDVDATSELLVETSTIANADDVTGNVISKADSIYVQFKQIDFDANGEDIEGYDKYEIVLVGGSKEKINELASADLTFDFVGNPLPKTAAMSYFVKEANGVSLTQLGDRFMFNYDGVTKYEESGLAIVIGTITVEGYGSYTLKTDAEAKNAVYATEIRNNIVDGFEKAATLRINVENIEKDGEPNDGMVGIVGTEKEPVVIAVPTRTLTINIDFPNAVEDNAVAYQDMKVEITGNIDGVNKTVTYKLGEGKDENEDILAVAMNTNGSYVVTEDRLVLNNAYTVTVSGAGYRTARYTVTMTEDKALRFWNNVMDNDTVVEEGKHSEKKNFLAGDIVKDNNINIYDLSAVVSYFSTQTVDENDNILKPEYAKYDLNRDGVIDSKDVAYVLVSWGE